MKRILCPTDFSNAAHGATAYAAKLAQATGSELTLLRVQSLFDATPIEMLTGSQARMIDTKERLEAQSREIAVAFRISCYAEVEPALARLSNGISRRARDFDLIVMGSDGPDDLYQFFGGSNTYNAIKKTMTPLIIIPVGCAYTGITKMVYAFDYLRERALPLSGMMPWVKALNCQLTILQVMEEARSKEADAELKELQLIIRDRYRDHVNLAFETIRSSDVAVSINRYAMQNQPDAVALCSVYRNLISRIFHKSVIRDISAICRCPVFVFHR